MSSSIFSFEPWTAIRRLPLRRQVWIVLVLVTGLATHLGSGWLLNRIGAAGQPGYVTHLQQRTLSEADARVLCLGNSTVAAGIAASQMRVPTVNLALAGSDFEVQELIGRNALKRMPNLQAVLLDMDNLPLLNDNLAARKSDFRGLYHRGVPWWDIPQLKLQDHFWHSLADWQPTRAVHVGPKLDHKGLTRHLRKLSKAKTPPPPKFDFDPLQGERKMEGYFRALSGDKVRAARRRGANLAALKRLIEDLHRRQVRLVFIRVPKVPEFWAARPQQWDDELNDAIRFAQSVNGGRPILLCDLERDPRFTHSHFNDPNHLNKEGAQLFTKVLDQQLAEAGIVTPAVRVTRIAHQRTSATSPK